MKKLKMYSTLARWWPILSSPADYKEEAAFFAAILQANCRPCRDVLELGSGGGSNASYLKKKYRMTLVDLSPGMIRVSRKLNPECRHIHADMRSVRLDRTFDAVFIHDAVMYLTSKQDLRRVFRTAYRHLRKGGCALVVPDHFKETFQSGTEHGGHDRAGKSMRYLEWRFDPDPRDSTYECHFAYLLKKHGGRVQVEYDQHVMGLFPKAVWLTLMRRSGFRVSVVPIDHSELAPGTYHALVGIKK